MIDIARFELRQKALGGGTVSSDLEADLSYIRVDPASRAVHTSRSYDMPTLADLNRLGGRTVPSIRSPLRLDGRDTKFLPLPRWRGGTGQVSCDVARRHDTSRKRLPAGQVLLGPS